jgi:NitT/TauT family transport system permease protein
MNFFKLQGTLTKQQSLLFGALGIIAILGIWELMAYAKATTEPKYKSVMPKSVVGLTPATIDSLQIVDDNLRDNATEDTLIYSFLPRPVAVFMAFGEVYKNDKVFDNARKSIFRNLQGYFWAILISIPLGFMIGLLPIFNGMFNGQVNALRYLPITALTGLFIAWFGSEEEMKVSFLAFGIIVYLLPVVIQRIREVEDIHLKMVFTLNASSWQTIKTVYLPAVFSKLSDDVRVLTAISWTYIIIAELLNNQGGLGSLIYFKSRLGHLDEVFVVLAIIIIIGFIQDLIFQYLDRILFPHKHFKSKDPLINTNVEQARLGLLAFFIGLIIAILVHLQVGFFSQDFLIAGRLAMLAGIGFMLYSEFNLYRALKTE